MGASIDQSDLDLLAALRIHEHDSKDVVTIRTFFGDKLDRVSSESGLGRWLAGIEATAAATESNRLNDLSARVAEARGLTGATDVRNQLQARYVSTHLPLLHSLLNSHSWWTVRTNPVAWDQMIAYVNSVPAPAASERALSDSVTAA